jgi:two-component system nitrogen regulation response regulator NtrX
MELPLVMIVDDDPTFRYRVAELLDEAGHPVRVAAGEEQALAMLAEEEPAVIVLDAWPGSSITTPRLVESIRRATAGQRLPLIVCSPDERLLDAHSSYLRQQGCALFGRPFDRDRLLTLVQRVTVRPYLGCIAREAPLQA